MRICVFARYFELIIFADISYSLLVFSWVFMKKNNFYQTYKYNTRKPIPDYKISAISLIIASLTQCIEKGRQEDNFIYELNKSN